MTVVFVKCESSFLVGIAGYDLSKQEKQYFDAIILP